MCNKKVFFHACIMLTIHDTLSGVFYEVNVCAISVYENKTKKIFKNNLMNKV